MILARRPTVDFALSMGYPTGHHDGLEGVRRWDFGLRVEYDTLARISVIFGTRPEAIKLAPVILALKDCSAFDCRVCVTAQHREMLDQVLDVFGVVPDEDLDLMKPGQSLGELTARAVAALDAYIGADRPDLVLVQGDTTTVFCAALAAFYHNVPVGHVEAGLRTGNMRSPWPEEANRVLTSRLTTLHFAPTERAKANLLSEGVPPDRIFVTGNTVIDALLMARERTRACPPEVPQLPDEAIASWGTAPVVLITIHRRESFGEGLESICRAIDALAERFPEAQFILPVHPNPNVKEPIMRLLHGGRARPNIHLINPLPYLAFVRMMDRSTIILTDSGGIQEEAPCLGKPVLVMRDTTERPEGVAAGTAKLVGANTEAIIGEASLLLSDPEARKAMARCHNPYGDGGAADRILEACASFFADEGVKG